MHHREPFNSFFNSAVNHRNERGSWTNDHIPEASRYMAKLCFYNYKCGHEILASMQSSDCHFIFTRGQFWPSGIVVACVCVCVSVCVCVNHLLVRAITQDPFKLGSPNLDQRCKRPWLRSLLIWGGQLTLTSRSNLTSKSEFTQFWACPDHNSLPIQARITKFGPEVENSLVKVPIVLGGNWPRPSRSNLI